MIIMQLKLQCDSTVKIVIFQSETQYIESVVNVEYENFMVTVFIVLNFELHFMLSGALTFVEILKGWFCVVGYCDTLEIIYYSS